MEKGLNEKNKKSLTLWAVLSGFVATLLTTAVMFLGNIKLGTPFIPELIAQRLFPAVSPESDYPASAVLIHLAIGTFHGAFFIAFIAKAKIKRLLVPVLMYSIFLWFIFSAIALPFLGFGLFGKYLVGVPAMGEIALLIYYLLYGFVLYLFLLRLKNSPIMYILAK